MSKSDFYRLFTGGDGSIWEPGPESIAEGPSDVPTGVPSDREEMVEMERRVAELAAAYEKDPASVLRDLSEAFELPADREGDFRKDIEQALERTKNLDEAQVEAEEILGREGVSLPRDYIDNVVERYRDANIDINPNTFRFEDDSLLGILGWALFNGPQSIAVPRTGGEQDFRRLADSKGRPFRSHVGTASGYQYRLDPAAPGQPLRIALFADFGTGLAHSRYIARQIEVDRPASAVHLGDVYYTGTRKQYYEYFTEPLKGVIASDTKLFVIPDNHEGYSAFEGYLEFLDENRSRFPRTQEQEGSYFCIVGDRVQLIGVDTIWNSTKGRIHDGTVLGWLRERLQAGRNDGRANVLLTGHHPYEYGKAGTEKLFADLKPIVDDDLVDFWFWGNTHYCALFDRTESFSFYGSCIGHGGYPYKAIKSGKTTPADPLFLETGSRYEPTDVRADRGMNGYCVLEVHDDGRLRLQYIDWLGRLRHEEDFALDGAKNHFTKR